jgi:hypothetical protein
LQVVSSPVIVVSLFFPSRKHVISEHPKKRKLKLIRCLRDLLLLLCLFLATVSCRAANDTVPGATSHHQLYAAWAAAAAAAFTGQHPSQQHATPFWPPIQAAAAAAEGLLAIDQVKKAGNDAGNVICYCCCCRMPEFSFPAFLTRRYRESSRRGER